MRTIITGATGFIGRALAARFPLENVIPMRREYYESWQSAKHFIEWCGAEQIYHLAAYGNHSSQKETKQTILTNIFGSINIFIGSGSIPVVNLTTSSITLQHQTDYSISKHSAAIAAKMFPNVRNVMPYSVFGPGEAANRFIPTVIRCIITGEEMFLDEYATHDWIYIDDFINALLAGHTVIGTGKKFTNIEIVRKLEEISGKKLNYTTARMRDYDNENWVAPFGVYHIHIDEALLKTYIYYRNAIKTT